MKKTSILLVDDEPQLLRLVRSNLELAGYRVFTALDARNALKLVDTEMPDLIILDIVMPKMEGGEVAGKLALGKLGYEYKEGSFVHAVSEADAQSMPRRLDFIDGPEAEVGELGQRVEQVLHGAEPPPEDDLLDGAQRVGDVGDADAEGARDGGGDGILVAEIGESRRGCGGGGRKHHLLQPGCAEPASGWEAIRVWRQCRSAVGKIW